MQNFTPRKRQHSLFNNILSNTAKIMALIDPANSSKNANVHTPNNSLPWKCWVLSTLVDTGKCNIIIVPSHGTCQGDVFRIFLRNRVE